MTYNPGAEAPADGVYWCSVCKTPQSFSKGEQLPPCPNMCGRCHWELIEKSKSE